MDFVAIKFGHHFFSSYLKTMTKPVSKKEGGHSKPITEKKEAICDVSHEQPLSYLKQYMCDYCNDWE